MLKYNVKEKAMTTVISKATLQRLPIYLNCLKSAGDTSEYVSATALANRLGLGEVQVRKDLASICDAGKPKVGYLKRELIAVLENYLGADTNDAVLVGVGHLGTALMAYNGFEEYGFKIVAGFDVNPVLVGAKVAGKQVFSVDKMANLIGRLGVKIGIITLPKEYAQETADKLIAAGIRAIWNFSPTYITVPDNIVVKNENMASSLAVLSKQLKEISEK